MTTPELEIDDRALARLAAYETLQVPGIARLHPYALQVAVEAVTAAARKATAKLTGNDEADTVVENADLAAIDVDRDPFVLTIRVVATTDPPVLDAVRDVQTRVADAVEAVAGARPEVVVSVMDVDPAQPA